MLTWKQRNDYFNEHRLKLFFCTPEQWQIGEAEASIHSLMVEYELGGQFLNIAWCERQNHYIQEASENLYDSV